VKKNITKRYEEARVRGKVTCKCGHVTTFEPTSNKKKLICSYCGHYVYRNDKEKFKELMKAEMWRLK
jgi:hypothetical protein